MVSLSVSFFSDLFHFQGLLTHRTTTNSLFIALYTRLLYTSIPDQYTWCKNSGQIKPQKKKIVKRAISLRQKTPGIYFEPKYTCFTESLPDLLFYWSWTGLRLQYCSRFFENKTLCTLLDHSMFPLGTFTLLHLIASSFGSNLLCLSCVLSHPPPASCFSLHIINFIFIYIARSSLSLQSIQVKVIAFFSDQTRQQRFFSGVYSYFLIIDAYYLFRNRFPSILIHTTICIMTHSWCDYIRIILSVSFLLLHLLKIRK